MRPSAVPVASVTVGTGRGIFLPGPVQPVCLPFPTRTALFVSLLLWACLSWTEGSEGMRGCTSQRLPTSPVMHRARSVGLTPALHSISSLTLSNDCLTLWFSFLLCKMGLVSVVTHLLQRTSRVNMPSMLPAQLSTKKDSTNTSSRGKHAFDVHLNTVQKSSIF